MEYRVKKEGQTIEIWDDKAAVGIRFTEGESLQRYTHEVLLVNPEMTADEAGLAIINQCAKDLTEYAAKKWQKEFKEIK